MNNKVAQYTSLLKKSDFSQFAGKFCAMADKTRRAIENVTKTCIVPKLALFTIDSRLDAIPDRSLFRRESF